MISKVSLPELERVIRAEHSDPHCVLGMHVVSNKGKDCISVRAFIPQAKKVTLIDIADESKKYELVKIHVDGFFETLISDRTEWFMYKFAIESEAGDNWTSYDPYSFQPTIGEMDLYLYGEGTHYQIFDKLGAHPMVVNEVEGVSFAVWAPNAARVSVIGDFNVWDGRRNPMRTLSSSGIWEIFIPGLQKYDKYKFEIKTHSGDILQKADPYGSFAEMRPYTSSMVYDTTQYKWNDEEWIKDRTSNPHLNKPINIYELHLGSWKRVCDENGGERFMTYDEMVDEIIPYVKEMGYTHIELMPVEEHPFDGSWGYQVVGYFAPTSRYGDPEGFMHFVDQCHQNNIAVILDWVPAHFPKDAHGLAMFDGTALYEHADKRQGEHPDWGTLIFNYGRKEVKNFLIANAIFWIERYHIDGLRVDAVASMLYLDYGKNEGEWVANESGGRENLHAVEFMKHMNSVILGRYPSVLMVAEESTAWAGVSRPVESGGLGFNLKWNMGWMNDFLSYIQKDPIHRKYHHNDLTFALMYAFSENFVLVLSHDEVVHGKGSMINKMPGDLWQKFANLRLSYGFMYGHPGKKLQFMGNEFGQFAEWSEAKSLDWHLLEYDHHRQMKDFVKDLNNLYAKENSLWNNDFGDTGFEWVDCLDHERSIVSFIRKGSDPDDILLFVSNFTPVPYMNYRLGVPKNCAYEEILNSDAQKYGGGDITNPEIIHAEDINCHGREQSIEISLPPLATVIFRMK